MVFVLYVAPAVLTVPYILYPVIMSVMSIEQKQPDRTRWLIFWLIYNTVTSVEALFQFLLQLIPGYSLVKLAYLTWCMAPMVSNGSVVTYRVLRPMLLEEMLRIDEYIIDSIYKLETIVREKEGLATMAVTLGASAALSGNSKVPPPVQPKKKNDSADVSTNSQATTPQEYQEKIKKID